MVDCSKAHVARRRTIALACVLTLPLVATSAAGADSSIDFHAYGSADYSATNHGGTNSSFSGSQLDFSPTAHIGKLDVVGEVLVEPDLSNNLALEVDQLSARYTVGDALRVVAGRFYTPLGYYNTAHTHANFLDLTTARPWLVSFENGGGFLPLHLVGVGIEGAIPLGDALKVSYNVDVANTRGYTPEETVLLDSHTNSKAINARLRFSPEGLPGFHIGGNFMFDRIPARPSATADGVSHLMNEFIAGAHLAYVNEDGVHAINEFYYIDHEDVVTSQHFITLGGFSEVGYSFSHVTPYIRGEAVHTEHGLVDPYYNLVPSNLSGDVVKAAMPGQSALVEGRVGVTWTGISHLAFKVEGTDSKRTGPRGGGGLPEQQSIAVQAAFSF